MTEPSREKNATSLRISENGKPGDGVHVARYCAFCGVAAGSDGAAPERFGEVFCSVGHAEEFVKGVRAARANAVAAASEAAEPATAGAADATAVAAKGGSWKQALKMAACCGAPMLALVVLAGGGGALLGAAGAVLPLLAALACPLGMFFMMFFMMRARSKGQQQQPKDNDQGQ